MNFRLILGTILTYTYNVGLGKLPSRRLRRLFLRLYLGNFGAGTGIQMGCKFLNGRKVHLGDRNVINFGCLLDGRKFRITTGSGVSIGPEASILTLGRGSQSPGYGAGVAFEPDDANSLAQALRSVIRDFAELRALARERAFAAREGFSAKRFFEIVEGVPGKSRD